MEKQLGFHVDVAKCTGCKTCQVACKAKKLSPEKVSLRRVYEYAGGSWQAETGRTWRQDVFAYYVSISCNHCAQPACTASCPTTAMHKDKNGLVSVDNAKCVGCRYCEWNCPYGAPQFNVEIGQMTKCDGCADRLTNKQQPLCVAACPLRALDFGSIEELRKKYGALAAIAPLPSAETTKPNLCLTGGKHARPCKSRDGAILNGKEV